MNIIKAYTSIKWLESVKKCLLRFPLALLFLVLFVISLHLILYHTDGEIINGKITYFCAYYFSTATLLSVALQLWNEEVKRKSVRLSVQGIAQLLWLGGALYLTSCYGKDMDIVVGLSTLSSIVALVIAVFLISFFRSHPDLELWNFSKRLFINFFFLGLAALLLTGGVDLLLLSFDKLFGLDITGKVYDNVALLCLLLLAPVAFLCLLPEGADKHQNENLRMSSFARLVTFYVLLPLLLSYLATLYLYALKIILTWTLPCGWVSWLVATLMMGTLAFLMTTYPQQLATEKPTAIDTLIKRLPLLVLPLLVLMSVGIFRRFSDYGITVSRLYLLLFNLWCYAVCIGLTLQRKNRFHWIPLSFGLLFLIVSYGPQSFSNVTLRALSNEVKSQLDINKVSYPLNQKSYQQWMESLDSTTAKRMNDKLLYLRTTYRDDRLASLIDEEVALQFGNDNDHSLLVESALKTIGSPTHQQVTIPVGSTHAVALTNQPFRLEGDTLVVDVTYRTSAGETKHVTFQAPVETLRATPIIRQNGQTLYLQNHGVYSMRKQDGWFDAMLFFDPE